MVSENQDAFHVAAATYVNIISGKRVVEPVAAVHSANMVSKNQNAKNAEVVKFANMVL